MIVGECVTTGDLIGGIFIALLILLILLVVYYMGRSFERLR